MLFEHPKFAVLSNPLIYQIKPCHMTMESLLKACRKYENRQYKNHKAKSIAQKPSLIDKQVCDCTGKSWDQIKYFSHWRKKKNPQR